MAWYRAMKLDQCVLWDVLPVPVVEEQDWALFEGEACQATDQRVRLIPSGSTFS